MTKKDYALIAAAIRDAAEVAGASLDPAAKVWREAQTHVVLSALSERLQADNPRFDADRFARAALPAAWFA